MKVRWLLLGLFVTLALVPAGLVTAARILDLPGGLWVRLVAFTPLAGGLYLLALVLLLVASWRGSGFWRGAVRLLAALSFLGVVVHAVWASGPFVGTPADDSAARRAPVHVMTANLMLGQADTAQVVRLALTQHVDVLVLQEVTPLALSGLRQAGVGQVFAHHAGKPASGPRGTMVFSRTRLSGVRRLATGYAGKALDVRLPPLTHARGGRVHLLALHPRPPLGRATQWHADQMVVQRAARSQSGPTLLAGDFNATMDHTPLRELVGRGFADAATEATSRWQPTWPSAGVVTLLTLPVPSLLAIDHVFLRHGPRAVHTESFTLAGTDHRALVVAVGR
jgi:endonuclease/exonuclease/phosphatase (EEP) superfamily protein YafD